MEPAAAKVERLVVPVARLVQVEFLAAAAQREGLPRVVRLVSRPESAVPVAVRWRGWKVAEAARHQVTSSVSRSILHSPRNSAVC